jgi:hypothetical protein
MVRPFRAIWNTYKRDHQRDGSRVDRDRLENEQGECDGDDGKHDEHVGRNGQLSRELLEECRCRKSELVSYSCHRSNCVWVPVGLT